MIPIRADNPTDRLPWITLALIAMNISVFLYELSLSAEELSHTVAKWGFVPASTMAVGDPSVIVTLLLTAMTSMFLHAGWIHLGGNMLYLWVFGNNIEDRLGPVRFILFYLGAGIVAVAAQTIADRMSEIPLIGASGAVAGVLGAYVILYPRAKIITIVPVLFVLEMAAIPASFVIGFWFLLQIASGLGSLASTTPGGGVAWFAHIGGFAAGAAAMLPLAAMDRWHGRRNGRFVTWR